MGFGEVTARFLVGGIFVSAFAILSDILTPKSFAGLFGAAPSVALATLLLTLSNQGAGYAAIEARWMIGGALAFCVYAWFVMFVLIKDACSAKSASLLLLLLWMIVALGSRFLSLA
jgi:hypothetical protein